MSPILTLHRCGNATPQGQPCQCAECSAHRSADTQRRRHRQRDHGRSSQNWKKLSRYARLTRPCQACGTTHDLTTHLDPGAPCYPTHSLARLEDVTVLCRTCHGSLDAPRARR